MERVLLLVIVVLIALLVFKPTSEFSPVTRTYIAKEHIDRIHCFCNHIDKPHSEDDDCEVHYDDHDHSTPAEASTDAPILSGSSGSAQVDASAPLVRSAATSTRNNWTLYGSRIPVVDQGPFGSCTAFSARYAYLLRQSFLNRPLTEPSCAFWYASSRTYLGINNTQDTGSTLGATVQSLRNKPFVPETAWPYTAYNILRTPTNQTGASALPGSIITVYPGVPNKNTQFVTWCVSQINQNKSIVIGIPIYANMETYQVMSTGTVPMPKGAYLGGHAICLTGYNATTSVFNFVNSWGTYSGLSGHYTIPYNYVAKYTYEAFSL